MGKNDKGRWEEKEKKEEKMQKRKQANRDSARRSKIRKKKENEDLLTTMEQLENQHDSLTRQLSAAKERTSQLTNLNQELKEQLSGFGVAVT